MREYTFKVEMYNSEVVFIDGTNPVEVLERALRCYDSEVRRITMVPKDMNKDAQTALFQH
jgi:hypothetical protein